MALAEIILSAALGFAGSFLDIYGHDTVLDETPLLQGFLLYIYYSCKH